MAESDNVLTRLHDLMVYIVPVLAKFPRDQKFVLGDRIEVKLLDIQECCVRAYFSRDKRQHLAEANLEIEIVRHLVRLTHDLKLFNTQRYGTIAEKLNEIGRMIGGWLKHASSTERQEVKT